jgi:hypothetical protein
MMMTLWNPDYILGSVAKQWHGTDYAQRYGYLNQMPILEVLQDGRKLDEYVLLWMSAADSAVDLARFIDVLWPQIDAAVIAGSREQSA